MRASTGMPPEPPRRVDVTALPKLRVPIGDGRVMTVDMVAVATLYFDTLEKQREQRVKRG